MKTRALLAHLVPVSIVCASVGVSPAYAQRASDGARTQQLSTAQALPSGALRAITPRHEQRLAGSRPAILLTGYWPPSNEALRRFSDDPVQNPDGWIGANWEGRGYDVYSYFPEFNPRDCSNCGKGTGDFEVDYQDTSADFWPIVNALQPIAVMTFSRGFFNFSWELEMNQYNRFMWGPDYLAPTQPTPAPPDASLPVDALRLSTLPVQAIVNDVNAANLGLNSYICFSGNGGGFLSEFMAYHGVWYQNLHQDPLDPAWCIAGGHVHVGGQMSWEQAQRAAKTSLRALIRHVDQVLDPLCHDTASYCETATNSAGPGAWISSTGSTSLGASDLSLIASEAPALTFGMYFYGALQQQVPWGNGNLCVAGTLYRISPIMLTNAEGYAYLDLDYSLPPFSGGPGQINPGSTWHFQYVFRDNAAGGARFNATNALSATFCP